MLRRGLLLGSGVPPSMGGFSNPAANELTGVPLGIPLHPTQLYEAGAELAIFAFLYLRFARPHRTGTILGFYLALYSSVRLLVEFIRAHEQPNPFEGPFSTTQWIAMALLITGCF